MRLAALTGFAFLCAGLPGGAAAESGFGKPKAVDAAASGFVMPEDENEAEFVTSNLIAVFYHELGHGLIDVLDLPVLGREEDAVDALSTILIDQIWQEDAAVVLTYDTALAWASYAAEAEGGENDLAMWDNHSLDMQRYYNHICLFYGANPELREDIAVELELPEARAESCPEEFELASASWGAMLEDLTPGDDARGLRLSGVTADDPIGGILAEEIGTLNAEYGLPEWIDVKVEACGEANAFYYPAERSITMCTEYADDLVRLYRSLPE